LAGGGIEDIKIDIPLSYAIKNFRLLLFFNLSNTKHSLSEYSGFEMNQREKLGCGRKKMKGNCFS
jgi:hypothetical protein